MDAPVTRSLRGKYKVAAISALVLLALGLSIQYSIKATQRSGHRSAFLRWRPQVQEMAQGINVHETHLYPNPPIMGLILLPIMQWPEMVGLPPLAGALSWFFLKVIMTILIFHWLFRMVEDPARPFPLWAKVLTVGLSIRPIAGDLSHGNVNLFIFFLVAAALYALHCRRQLASGLLLALAIACKITPALFLPYLVWKRAGKALAGCTVGLMLFLYPGLIPAGYFGWNHNQDMVQSWVKNMVKPFVIDGFVTSEHNNQSLPGTLTRLLTHSPSFSDYDEDLNYIPTDWHNVATVKKITLRWVVKGVMLLFVLLIAWTCRPTLSDGLPTRNAARAAEYSLVLLGMLLFSERTWKHHCVTLALPFTVICYYLAIEWQRKSMRRYLIGTLVAVLLLISTTSTSIMGDVAGKLGQVYGAYTIAFMVMMAALAILLRFGADAQSATPTMGKEPSAPLPDWKGMAA